LTPERDAARLLAWPMPQAAAADNTDPARTVGEEPSTGLAARRALAETEALETVTVSSGGTTACASHSCLLAGTYRNGGACVVGEGLAFRCECVLCEPLCLAAKHDTSRLLIYEL
jgi:hypothetical protein